MDERLTPARTSFFKAANKKNIQFRALYDYDTKSRLDLVRAFGGNGQYRFLPKGYSTNSGVQIFGDYVVNYTELLLGATSDNAVFFVIHSSTLADSYRIWFQYLWDKSSPVPQMKRTKQR